MEFPQTSRLGFFVAETGNHIAEFRRFGIRIDFILDIGTHHTRRAFRLQSDAPAGVILKYVHLLLDDIRRISHTSLKQLRMLEYRRPDLLNSVISADLPECIFNILPFPGLSRKDILRPLRGLCKH